jgi:hypothetical protein
MALCTHTLSVRSTNQPYFIMMRLWILSLILGVIGNYDTSSLSIRNEKAGVVCSFIFKWSLQCRIKELGSV